MIIKSYQTKNIDENIKYILLNGLNTGAKFEEISKLTLNYKKENIYNYNETQILENKENFFGIIMTKSLFEDNKIIIIDKATDKILKIIEEVLKKNIEDIKIIINSESLEKKSKLRSLFEKDKSLICVPFYPDNSETLSKLAFNFLKGKNISLSQSNINMVISKCNGDRSNLFNELNKIELFCKNGKKINSENISKLINLSENHGISELVDNCLAKNKKKTTDILNENNFSNEDCIMIVRSFLIKAKKLLILSKTFEANKNIDLTMSSAKPPIFWKEKEITKQQIYKWKPKNIKKLIYTLGETELRIKKNINNSINLITDFILFHSSSTTNN